MSFMAFVFLTFFFSSSSGGGSSSRESRGAPLLDARGVCGNHRVSAVHRLSDGMWLNRSQLMETAGGCHDNCMLRFRGCGQHVDRPGTWNR